MFNVCFYNNWIKIKGIYYHRCWKEYYLGMDDLGIGTISECSVHNEMLLVPVVVLPLSVTGTGSVVVLPLRCYWYQYCSSVTSDMLLVLAAVLLVRCCLYR